jgi:ubiquinone/menaquinone biosynthesis C-methylase UbiE
MDDDRKFFTDGAAYERFMGRWSQIVGVKFIEWLATPKGLRWLDVGCGNGAFSEVLISSCPPSELHGIDPSEPQIAYAKSRVPNAVAQFRVGDGQNLPFDDASFDIATMALVISFVPDPDKAVAEMARVVRPGGWVASFMWDAPGGGLPASPIAAAARELGLTSQTPVVLDGVYSFDQLRAVWEGAGLEKIETQRIDISITYENFDDLWESNQLLATPTSTMVSKLTASERERLKSHLYDTLPRDDVGQITSGAFVNAIKGKVLG